MAEDEMTIAKTHLKRRESTIGCMWESSAMCHKFIRYLLNITLISYLSQR